MLEKLLKKGRKTILTGIALLVLSFPGCDISKSEFSNKTSKISNQQQKENQWRSIEEDRNKEGIYSQQYIIDNQDNLTKDKPGNILLRAFGDEKKKRLIFSIDSTKQTKLISTGIYLIYPDSCKIKDARLEIQYNEPSYGTYSTIVKNALGLEDKKEITSLEDLKKEALEFMLEKEFDAQGTVQLGNLKEKGQKAISEIKKPGFRALILAKESTKHPPERITAFIDYDVMESSSKSRKHPNQTKDNFYAYVQSAVAKRDLSGIISTVVPFRMIEGETDRDIVDYISLIYQDSKGKNWKVYREDLDGDKEKEIIVLREIPEQENLELYFLTKEQGRFKLMEIGKRRRGMLELGNIYSSKVHFNSDSEYTGKLETTNEGKIYFNFKHDGKTYNFFCLRRKSSEPNEKDPLRDMKTSNKLVLRESFK
jgi:hypothetical protein